MTIHAPFIESLNSTDLQKASETLLKLSPELVGCNNWPDQYPETPTVYVRVAHNNKEIFVRFDVEEHYTVAHVEKDNGEVWYDSTCEFFITFDDLGYYNIETTCIGKVLLGFQKTLPDQILGSTDSINRLPSLGTETFDEKVGDNKWNLTYAVPLSAFWKHNLTSLHGVKAHCNFYKCGDSLSKPHFITWRPIKNPKPFFHMPEFFGEIDFE
ncbi:hypothetical protein M9Y10_041118 [Tritrichomonas musculus]|uniref:Carbohydrate-binding domain-containing protein n=1 Tax=Tritrichomonas musculus TaxID=1915356 RepID=A0ABR2K4J6_9EUKA